MRNDWDITERCEHYFETLLNEESTRNRIPRWDPVLSKEVKAKVEIAVKEMKNWCSTDLGRMPTEFQKSVGA